ncbi:MAG: CHAT domain-containing protein [Caldilineaceae bacterium]
MIDAALLETLLQSKAETHPALLQKYGLGLETIQQLKEISAEFYFTEPARALHIAETAYALSQQMPSPAPALGHWTLGNALMFVGRYAEADRHFQQARHAYLAAANWLDAARMGVGHVGMLAYNGDSEGALALAAEIEPILTTAAAESRDDRQRLGKLLMNAGVAHELLGHYEEALTLYERQQQIAEQLADQLMLAQLTNNKAHALVQIGSFTEAISAYQSAEQLFAPMAAQADQIRLYYNYAALLAMLGQYEEARALQDKAEILIAGLESVELQAHWLTLVRAQLDLQAHWPITDELIERLCRAQRAFGELGPAFAAGLVWIVLGRCHLRRRAWQAAQQALAQAQQHAEQYADRTLIYRVYHGLGQLADAQNQIAAAVTAYRAAIRQIESIRGEFHIETLRADFLTDKLGVYQDLTSLYTRSAQFEEAFQVIERAKARLLTEKLTSRLSQEAHHFTAVEDEQLRALTTELKALLQRLDQLYRQARVEGLQSGTAQGHQPTVTTATTIAEVESQSQRLTHQIQRRRPLFSVYATGEPTPLARVQSHLQERLLLQYFVNQDHVCAYVVGATGILGHYQLAPLAEVDAARQGFSTAVEQVLALSANFGLARTARYIPSLLSAANAQLQRLYQALFQPLESALAPYKTLIIAPDQTLHYIPFHALYNGARYLVEEYTFSYTPSATVLDLCLEHQAPGKGVLLCGYDNQDLAAVATELEELQALAPQADCFIGAACRAETFLERAEHYGLVHLATHAKFRMDQPLLSSLVLADRQLTLTEISQLQLQADLVILSGCETGHGQLRGADLLSLAGGFLSAGARSLLVSLWRVEDRMAAQLMTTFYQALLAGASRADALRTAQLALLQQAEPQQPESSVYRHPAYWAPFTLIGNWLPVSCLQPEH